MPNLANVHRYISAGFARLDFHQLDNKGLPAGVTGTVSAGATGVAAGRITAVVTANINIPAADAVPVPGDNILQGTFQFPSIAARTFDLQFSEDDFDDRQAFQSIKTVNKGNHSFAGRDISPFTLNNALIIGVSNASAQALGVKGLGMYAGVIASRCQMTVRGRNGFTNRAAALYEGTVTLNNADAYPWGETYNIADEGYLNAFVQDWTEAYPVTVHRWTGLTSISTLFLGERPASTDTNDVLLFSLDTNGIPTQVTAFTINQANNTLALTTPMTATDAVAYYGYSPS